MLEATNFSKGLQFLYDFIMQGRYEGVIQNHVKHPRWSVFPCFPVNFAKFPRTIFYRTSQMASSRYPSLDTGRKLTHFQRTFHFYALWKHQKTFAFPNFQGVHKWIIGWKWVKRTQYVKNASIKILRQPSVQTLKLSRRSSSRKTNFSHEK